MEELLKDRIVALFTNYQDLKKISEDKQRDITSNKEQIKNGTMEDLESRLTSYQDTYIDFMLIVEDSKIVFNKLFTLIDTFKVMCKSSLPEDIADFYEKNRHFCSTEMFIIKNGNLEEKEEGSLQKKRDAFMKSDFLSKLIQKNNV